MSNNFHIEKQKCLIISIISSDIIRPDTKLPHLPYHGSKALDHPRPTNSTIYKTKES